MCQRSNYFGNKLLAKRPIVFVRPTISFTILAVLATPFLPTPNAVFESVLVGR